nr:MAG TPA: hypothetical protein [Caudoviricetes sp.]
MSLKDGLEAGVAALKTLRRNIDEKRRLNRFRN